MFRPYRQRLQLLDGHKNFTEAMLAWLAEKGSDRGKETVQYELKVTRHRLQLVEEFQLQFGEPAEHIDDEPDSEGEMEADGTADNNDPLVALFGARPSIGVGVGCMDMFLAFPSTNMAAAFGSLHNNDLAPSAPAPLLWNP